MCCCTLQNSLSVLGIPFSDIMRVLCSVLLLGNVRFVEGAGLELDVHGNNGASDAGRPGARTPIFCLECGKSFLVSASMRCPILSPSVFDDGLTLSDAAVLQRSRRFRRCSASRESHSTEAAPPALSPPGARASRRCPTPSW